MSAHKIQMDRLVEKSVFVIAARLGLIRLKAPPGSARETGLGKQERLACTPGSRIDGLVNQAGLGAGLGLSGMVLALA